MLQLPKIDKIPQHHRLGAYRTGRQKRGGLLVFPQGRHFVQRHI